MEYISTNWIPQLIRFFDNTSLNWKEVVLLISHSEIINLLPTIQIVGRCQSDLGLLHWNMLIAKGERKLIFFLLQPNFLLFKLLRLSYWWLNSITLQPYFTNIILHTMINQFYMNLYFSIARNLYSINNIMQVQQYLINLTQTLQDKYEFNPAWKIYIYWSTT